VDRLDPVPGDQSIAQLLIGRARLRPDDIFAIFPDRSWTFGQLDAEARRVAAGLIAVGVAPGDHVATVMPNCSDWLPASFGAWYAGAVVVALNARYKRHELAFTIADSRARVVLTTDAITDHVDIPAILLDALPGAAAADPRALALACAPELTMLVLSGRLRAGFTSMDALCGLGDATPATAVDRAIATCAPDDPAALIYSSGTTANPKGCILSHAGLQRSWYTFAETVDLRAGDRVWTPMPFYHTGGIGPLTAILSRGAALMTQPHFEAEEALRLIAGHRVHHLYSGFPQLSLTVLQHPDYSPERFAFVRSMLNVGPPAMQRAIEALLPPGAHVLNLFGMTEGSGIITFTPIDAPLEIRATTSGRAPAHTEVRIVDPKTGAVCAPEDVGEIQFRGGGAFQGYYRAPELTAEAIVDGGWVRTGDRGKLDAEGWLHYLGRLKDMLKVGGENVACAEIEFFLNQHPDVKMVQVIGGADARMGEVPVAFVERTPGGTVCADQLVDMCRGQLSSWKIPAEIVFVEEWPMSATKVQKFRLVEQLPERFRAAT
jgi:acyl-CoA synthetase (AMP-forming)/AMP-acid ligase II